MRLSASHPHEAEGGMGQREVWGVPGMLGDHVVAGSINLLPRAALTARAVSKCQATLSPCSRVALDARASPEAGWTLARTPGRSLALFQTVTGSPSCQPPETSARNLVFTARPEGQIPFVPRGCDKDPARE